MNSQSRILLILLPALLIIGVTGCCRRQPVIPGSRTSGAGSTESVSRSNPEAPEKKKPLTLLENTGLNYSIDSKTAVSGKPEKKAGNFFEQQYLEGVELMEKGEFGKAISLFDELIKRYPNSEEASIAELCIAELHFRNKSNDLALKAFERIVELYPQSHAAENARSGIDYLRSIERFENEYVSPDVEARKRKGY
jgi:TolA-binding protein